MTNGEKAEQIRDSYERHLLEETSIPRIDIEYRGKYAMLAALEMANYKDKKFAAILDSVNHNAFPTHDKYVDFIKSLISI